MHRKRMYRAALAAAVVTVGSAAIVSAADPLTVFKIADEWGTINPSGPRTGVNGVRFWNAEGANNGSFASTAPFRFQTADLTSQFDAQFGVGHWKISNVNIVLSQSNAAFTKAGGVKLFTFANDTLPITNGVDDGNPGQFSALGVSPLRYQSGVNALDTKLADGTTDPTAIFGSFSQVDTYQFTSTGSGGDWPLDVLAPKNPDNTYRLVDPESAAIQIGSPNYGISTPIVSPTRPFRSDTLANFDAYTQRVGTNLNIAPIAADLESGSDALSFILVADPATAATYKGNPFGGDFPARIYITAEEIAARLSGDANLDGIVNQLDLNMIIENWLATGATWEANGDVTEDGIVNQLDYNGVVDNWLSTGSAAPSLSVAVVPEPASVGLLAMFGALLLGKRRRS